MRSSICALLILGGATVSSVVAQTIPEQPVQEQELYALDSGVRPNPLEDSAVVFDHTVQIDGAAWLRLYFGEVILGEGSFIRVTSLLDGEVQELDANQLAMWTNSTAYFNGDAVLLELVSGPGTTGNRVVLEEVGRNILRRKTSGGGGQCGICGSDDRVPSSEEWTSRLFPAGCTASVYTTDSCMVSAGHCIGGSMVVQFNVPNSNGNCSLNSPPVADQFPILEQTSVNGGPGNDWAVMTTGTNNLGQQPYDRFGVLRPIAGAVASTGQMVDLFGYGADLTCTLNQTQQWGDGPINQVLSNQYRFSIDLRGGSSGSSLLLNDEIIGIVTHCPCPNVATRIDLNSFEAARDSLCPGENQYTTLPFFDDFPTTTFDAELWTGIDDATIDGVGIDEPSEPFALRINGSDEARTALMNTTNADELLVSYWWQRRGGGNSPEAGEDLLVEYQISPDVWVELNSHPGDGPDMTAFEFASLPLPPDAFHNEFRLRFRGTSANFGVDDWFIDDVSIAPPPEDATTPLPFIDNFPSTDLDTSLWIGIDGASVDVEGNGEPSPPFSLNIDGTEEIRSALMDTSGGGLVLTYFWQRTGNGNSPEVDDDLFVEYFNNVGEWAEIASHPGDGPDDEPYASVSIPLPPAALHADFRIRFRTVGTTGGQPAGFDDWFVDDVCVGTPEQCLFVPECETALDCDDGIFCTDDTCSGTVCVHTPNDASCDDGVGCTADVCSAASDCSNTPDDAACDDGNGCTIDTCDAGVGCVNPPDVGAGCNDGSVCTENDACDASGDCVGDDIDCDDGNGCTIDTCNAGSGCQSTPDVGASCDDGIECTENDACDADGACVGDDTNCPDIVELVGQINNDLPICQDPDFDPEDEIDTPLMVCDVYAQFISANDLLISVAFADIGTTSPSGFFHHSFGANTSQACAFIPRFPALVCDSFVTIANTCDDGTDATVTDPDFNINPDDPDNPLDWFNEGGRVFGGWFNGNPTNDQSVPDADLRILVARLSVPVGFSISGTLDAFVKINGELPIVVLPDLFFECASGTDCNEACPTDVNGDNNTGPADLAALLGCWGPATAGVCLCLDANGDGQIGPADLAALLAAWGACP